MKYPQPVKDLIWRNMLRVGEVIGAGLLMAVPVAITVLAAVFFFRLIQSVWP